MWYDAVDAVASIGEGEIFETPVVEVGAPLTYWVEANTIYGSAQESGGKADNAGDGGIPSAAGKLFFNVTEPFTLLEVTVYVPAGESTGNRTIQLFDQNGTLIDEHIEAFGVGTHQVALNFEVPTGIGLSSGCLENNFFRNSGGVSYPYAIGSVGSIYDSTFGSSYYYYFYNWLIQQPQIVCPSDRVEVTASVAACNGDFNGDNVVNTYDLLFFLADFGCIDVPCPADIDGDGVTNSLDLLMLLGMFGIFCPS